MVITRGSIFCSSFQPSATPHGITTVEDAAEKTAEIQRAQAPNLATALI
jgi:hypothetical protein